MLFNSYIFILFFLPITLIGYFALNKYAYGKKGMSGIIWLFLMSLWFYGYEKPEFLILILGSILINFGISRVILFEKNKKPNCLQLQKWTMFFGVAFNLGILFYFKYADFFVDSIEDFFHAEWNVEVALPLGISFFTFQQISYIVDCYREEKGLHYNFFEYAAYVAFFPQLVAGPIVMHSELVPQLQDKKNKVINYTNMSSGLYAFALGMGKKVLIADTLSKVVNVGFAQYKSLSSVAAFCVMLSYTLQIYFDFSGYCDMALGMAKMFNVELPYNFNSPYKAKSISEFWERWHMTLTRFFTQYVYIPLGGSRKGKLRTYLNIMFVFLLSGIWHGANWTFMLWGIIHGLLKTGEKVIGDLKLKQRIKNPFMEKGMNVVRTLATFLLVNLAWVYFRADSIKRANIFITRLWAGGYQLKTSTYDKINDMIEIRLLKRLGLGGILNQYSWLPWICMLVILTFAVFFMRNTQEKLQTDKYNVRRSIVTIGILIWCIVSLSDISEFLYFNF